MKVSLEHLQQSIESSRSCSFMTPQVDQSLQNVRTLLENVAATTSPDIESKKLPMERLQSLSNLATTMRQSESGRNQQLVQSLQDVVDVVTAGDFRATEQIEKVLECMNVATQVVLDSTGETKLESIQAIMEDLKTTVGSLEDTADKMLVNPLNEFCDSVSRVLEDKVTTHTLQDLQKGVDTLKMTCDNYQNKDHEKRILAEGLSEDLLDLQNKLDRIDGKTAREDGVIYSVSATEIFSKLNEYLSCDDYKSTDSFIILLSEFIENNHLVDPSESVERIEKVFEKCISNLKVIKERVQQKEEVKSKNIQLASESMQRLAKILAGIKYKNIKKGKIVDLQKMSYSLQTAIYDLMECPLTGSDEKFLGDVTGIFENINSFVLSTLKIDGNIPVYENQVKSLVGKLEQISKDVKDSSSLKELSKSLTSFTDILSGVMEQLYKEYVEEWKWQKGRMIFERVLKKAEESLHDQTTVDVLETVLSDFGNSLDEYSSCCKHILTNDDSLSIKVTKSFIQAVCNNVDFDTSELKSQLAKEQSTTAKIMNALSDTTEKIREGLMKEKLKKKREEEKMVIDKQQESVTEAALLELDANTAKELPLDENIEETDDKKIITETIEVGKDSQEVFEISQETSKAEDIVEQIAIENEKDELKILSEEHQKSEKTLEDVKLKTSPGTTGASTTKKTHHQIEHDTEHTIISEELSEVEMIQESEERDISENLQEHIDSISFEDKKPLEEGTVVFEETKSELVNEGAETQKEQQEKAVAESKEQLQKSVDTSQLEKQEVIKEDKVAIDQITNLEDETQPQDKKEEVERVLDIVKDVM
ncbi:hypothetical protein JTB14_024366 [Gonioctena quinquepunctata]|nr:hypothetical protein JTB14_024366 [Gonioctena quinquepunctata]